ncbi:hypothetical protein SprV_0501853500 [Sparganum proliferum]
MISLDISEPCETVTKQPHLLPPRPLPLSPCTSPHRVHHDNHQTAGDHTSDAPPPPITTTIVPATTSAKATNFPTPATGENATSVSSTTTLTITAPTDSDVDSLPTCSHCENWPDRSLANPSHRDRQTNDWSTHIDPPTPPQLPALHSHMGLVCHMRIHDTPR